MLMHPLHCCPRHCPNNHHDEPRSANRCTCGNDSVLERQLRSARESMIRLEDENIDLRNKLKRLAARELAVRYERDDLREGFDLQYKAIEEYQRREAAYESDHNNAQ